MDRHAVTDLVLLGEERPYHRIAVAEANRRSIACLCRRDGLSATGLADARTRRHVVELAFPGRSAAYRRRGPTLPEPDWQRRHTQTFLAEAAYDLLYNLPNVFLWFLFPHYRRHALFHPLAEYAGWLRRLTGSRKRANTAKRTIDDLVTGATPFFVYPLQLQTDYQLRAHSPYNDQREAIGEILTSFAEHAPDETLLVVKVHPLDNGLIDWQRFILDAAGKLGIRQRVLFLDGGDLDLMLEKCRGVVTVNSTVGLQRAANGKTRKGAWRGDLQYCQAQ